MDWKNFFGTITMVCGVVFILVGITMQIIKQYHDRQCGFSLWLLIPALLVYFFRFCYDITIASWYLAIPDFFGTVLNGIVLYQYFLYLPRDDSGETVDEALC